MNNNVGIYPTSESVRNRPFKKTQIIKTQSRALSRSLISEYPGYSLISEPIRAREKHYSLVRYMLTANSHRDEVEVTIAIFTEPEVTNCFYCTGDYSRKKNGKLLKNILLFI